MAERKKNKKRERRKKKKGERKERRKQVKELCPSAIFPTPPPTRHSSPKVAPVNINEKSEPRGLQLILASDPLRLKALLLRVFSWE
ncbi:hypothetical protein GBA52_004537 [Prunus armeniaca]|nr:hypothetical protein GBA52_004537 [Prunus armeniaca]